MKVRHLILILCLAMWPVNHATTFGQSKSPDSGNASASKATDPPVKSAARSVLRRSSSASAGPSNGGRSTLQPSRLRDVAEATAIVPAIPRSQPDVNAIRRAVAEERAETQANRNQIRRVRLDEPISQLEPTLPRIVGPTPTEVRFRVAQIDPFDDASEDSAIPNPAPASDEAVYDSDTSSSNALPGTDSDASDSSVTDLFEDEESLERMPQDTLPGDTNASDANASDGQAPEDDTQAGDTQAGDTPANDASDTDANANIESDAGEAIDEGPAVDGEPMTDGEFPELPPLPRDELGLPATDEGLGRSPSDADAGELPPLEDGNSPMPPAKNGPRIPGFIQDNDNLSDEPSRAPRRRVNPPDPPAAAGAGLPADASRSRGRAGIDPDFFLPPKQQPQAVSTITSLLADPADQPDPCEPMRCEQMWQCAGGRCQSRSNLAMRGLLRTYQVSWSDRCGSCGGYTCEQYMAPHGRALCGPVFGSLCGVGLWRDHFGGAGMTRYGQYGVDVATLSGAGASNPQVGDYDLVGYVSDGYDVASCPSGNCGNTGGQGGLHACGCGGCEGRPEPWTLWGLAWGCREPAVTVGGWTSAGYHSRANGLFNDHPHRLNIHQSAAYVQRTADTTRQPIDFGFRFDALYGVDAQNTQSFGNTPGNWDFQNGLDHGVFGWALPQAYGEIAVNNASLMVGHFYTIMGYEVVAAPDNFFYSHSMTMNLSEPFTQTGALATWSQSPFVKWYGGWTQGWDTGFNHFADAGNFLGGFRLSLLNFLTASYTTTAGDFGRRGEGYAHSVVFATQLPNQWAYVLQSDVLRVGDEDNVGVNQYLLYDINRHLALGTRFEWWKGDRVTNYAPYGSTLPGGGSFSYYGATVGANVRLGTNFVLRPEGRIDWSPALDYSVGVGSVDMVMTY